MHPISHKFLPHLINFQLMSNIGVRGCPERDIPSLRVMGSGGGMLGNYSAAAVVAAAVAGPHNTN